MKNQLATFNGIDSFAHTVYMAIRLEPNRVSRRYIVFFFSHYSRGRQGEKWYQRKHIKSLWVLLICDDAWGILCIKKWQTFCHILCNLFIWISSPGIDNFIIIFFDLFLDGVRKNVAERCDERKDDILLSRINFGVCVEIVWLGGRMTHNNFMRLYMEYVYRKKRRCSSFILIFPALFLYQKRSRTSWNFYLD